MIYWNLFIGFLGASSFAFGGAYAAIPIIRDMVLSYGWITDETLSYMIAVAESTPGPIMVNLATYVGARQAGVLGAIIATFAVVLPSFLIIILIMSVFKHILENKYVKAVLDGLKPCVIGIILATGMVMTIENIVKIQEKTVDIRALIIAIILATMMVVAKKGFKKALSPIQLICISAILGAVIYSI